MQAKKSLSLFLPALLVAGLFATSPALAQDGPGRQGDPARRVERHLERLDEKLDLTDAQESEIRQILEAHASAQQGRREAGRQQFAATHDAVEAVLTPEQREALAELRTERREQRGDKRGTRRGDFGRRGQGLGQGFGQGPGFAALANRLDLTDAQEGQVKTLLEQRHEEARAWRDANPNATPEERQAFATAHWNATDASLEALLTPEQAEQYRALKEDVRDRRGLRDGKGPHGRRNRN